MAQSTQVEIQDIGPIRQAVIDLRPGCVSEIIGGNGAGKSTALKAVRTAVTGQNSGLAPRDGHKNGTVSVAGLTCKIGLKMTKRGEASETFVVIDDGDAIVQFINPGVKDPVAADKRRIAAMLSIAGVSGRDGAIKAFLGDRLASLSAQVEGSTLVEQVESLRRVLQAAARDAEGDVREAEGALSTIPAQEIPTEGKSVEQLRTAMTEASEQFKTASQRFKDAQEAKGRLASVTRVDVEAATRESQGCDLEVQELTSRLLDLQDELTRAQSCASEARAKKDAAVASESQYTEILEAIDCGITEDQLMSMQSLKDEAVSDYDTAVRDASSVAEIREAQQQRAVLLKKKEDAEHRATMSREKATAAPTLLTDAISQFPGWSVDEDMRICCEHRRGVIPFAELSPGEQAVRVIEFTLRGDAETGAAVAILPQEVWESLDHDNRQLVVQFAEQRNVAVVTARCSQERLECPVCLASVGLTETECPTCGAELSGGLQVKVLSNESDE